MTIHITKQDFTIRNVRLKNFVNLSEDEKIEILEWRNHELVRSMMITKDIISIENHSIFLQKLAYSNDKEYWIASYNNQKIGVIDLYDITDLQAFWGYYLNPKYIGSGYGILLEYIVLEIAFSIFKLAELQCESLSNNKSVIKTHQAFGYSTTEEKDNCTIQKIDYITFEKQKEMYELITRKFWE